MVKRFNFDKKRAEYSGFEEVSGLLGKNKEQKYEGSYEQVAKTIYSVVANKRENMRSLYKIVVMSYLLKNGDAHLKNFGVLYNNDMSNIRLAPAYDIVNTAVYFFKDRPALRMFGKKVWFARKELIKFAIGSCSISERSANTYYDECLEALKSSIIDLERYIIKNQEFECVGSKILDTWKLSLENKTHKEVPVEIRRNWNEN